MKEKKGKALYLDWIEQEMIRDGLTPEEIAMHLETVNKIIQHETLTQKSVYSHEKCFNSRVRGRAVLLWHTNNRRRKYLEDFNERLNLKHRLERHGETDLKNRIKKIDKSLTAEDIRTIDAIVQDWWI